MSKKAITFLVQSFLYRVFIPIQSKKGRQKAVVLYHLPDHSSEKTTHRQSRFYIRTCPALYLYLSGMGSACFAAAFLTLVCGTSLFSPRLPGLLRKVWGLVCVFFPATQAAFSQTRNSNEQSRRLVSANGSARFTYCTQHAVCPRAGGTTVTSGHPMDYRS